MGLSALSNASVKVSSSRKFLVSSATKSQAHMYQLAPAGISWYQKALAIGSGRGRDHGLFDAMTMATALGYRTI